MNVTRATTLLTSAALALALTACGSIGTSDTNIAAVVVRYTGEPALGKAAEAGALVTPFGVPTDPTGVAEGVTEAELFVSSGGVQLQFDDSGNVVESGGQPVLLTDGSVILQLPHGTYDFHIYARDVDGNVLADGDRTSIVVEAATTLEVPLLSLVGSASLVGPMVVVPNQVIDIGLLVHPPEREDLVVPTGDRGGPCFSTGCP